MSDKSLAKTERRSTSPSSSLNYQRAVVRALNVDDPLRARKMASEAAHLYPEDSELRKMVHILAPPQTRGVAPPSNVDWQANREWLINNWGEYKGKWVALRHGKVLGFSQSLDTLLQQVGRARDILFVPIR